MVGRDGEPGICPQLEDVIGRVEGQDRYQTFLGAQSRTAREFEEAWTEIKGEAEEICRVLGKEVEGPLAKDVVEAGGESTNGSTRHLIVEQRETLRHQLLKHALERHPDRRARPVTVFVNVADDKVAGRWLLATPSQDLSMSSPVFHEAMSSHLCLPSPAIRDGGWLGKRVGGRGAVIDKFGDEVMCCNTICGDSWRRRHDVVKQQVVTEATLAQLPVDCEVYGLFSDLLPAQLQEEGGELQWGRSRQGAVPDFKFLLPTPEGPTPRLAELKCINAGETWYPRGEGVKGTVKRADRLTYEYEKKLWDYDVRFHGAEPRPDGRRRGQQEARPGPLVSRLRGYGLLCQGQLVAGPWGDLSPHLHALLKICAEQRVEGISRAQGWEAGPGTLGRVMGEVRRSFSVTVVRAAAMCLFERLAHLGPGARAAAERRQLTLRLEERRRREREAFFMAHQGSGVSRVGRAFVP
jgi:hypothetical protein